MVSLDANVWVYFLDVDLPEHDAVRPDVESVLTEETVFTTTVRQMAVVRYRSNSSPRATPRAAGFSPWKT